MMKIPCSFKLVCITGRTIPVLGTILLLAACGDPPPGEGVKESSTAKPMPTVVSATQAVQSPDISAIDPATMQDAEIEKVIPPGPRCSFAYTAASRPVFAAAIDSGRDTAPGVIKIHGRLVEVTAREIADFEALVDGAIFTAGDIRLEVTPLPDEEAREQNGKRSWPGELLFEIQEKLRVGYHGWYTCIAR